MIDILNTAGPILWCTCIC